MFRAWYGHQQFDATTQRLKCAGRIEEIGELAI